MYGISSLFLFEKFAKIYMQKLRIETEHAHVILLNGFRNSKENNDICPSSIFQIWIGLIYTHFILLTIIYSLQKILIKSNAIRYIKQSKEFLESVKLVAKINYTYLYIYIYVYNLFCV